MYLHKIALAALIVLLIASCGKKEPVRPQPAANKYNILRGKEDDDGPIIMHVVLNAQLQPLSAAAVTMINGDDTFRMTTDTAGKCIFHLPRSTDWQSQISLADYLSQDTVIRVTDSFSIKTSILEQ